MIDPSTLPWWGWLLCGLVGVVVAAFASFIADCAENESWGCLPWSVSLVAGLGGLIAPAIGLVRLAKWAWG